MWPLVLPSILPSLGYAVLSSLWQGALLWLLYEALVKLLQPTAAQRYTMASAASAAALVLFFIGLLPAPAVSAPLQAGVLPVSVAVPFWNRLLPTLGLGYLLLAAWQLLRLAMGWQQVQCLRYHHTIKAPVAWRLFVQQYSAYMDIKKPVKLVLSSRVSGPLTIGFWKPIILFPVASVNQLSLAQAEAILIHELAHIRRADYLLNYLLQLSAAILFFNPFHRLLVQAACRDREISCDEWVLRYNYNRRDYAEALLQVEKMTLVSSRFAIEAVSQPGHELLHRIRLMLVPGTAPIPALRQPAVWWPTALVLMAMVVQLIMPAWHTATRHLPHQQSAAVLGPLPPLPAPNNLLAGKALRQLQQESLATAYSTKPKAKKAAAPTADRTVATTPPEVLNAYHSSDWTTNQWLQSAKDLLTKGNAVLQATDALPVELLEAELKAQLKAATAQLLQQFEKQLLNAQVLAAEANAARGKELAAAQAYLQATMVSLNKLNAARNGEILLEKKGSRLIVALPPSAEQTYNHEADIAAPTKRSYQFSYNEVSESLPEIPLFSPRTSLVQADSAATCEALSAPEQEALKQQAGPCTLQLAIPLPNAVRARLEKEAKASQRSSILPPGKPRVIISL